MASTKTRIKGIRVTNECVDYFEGKPLNRMVESLMELIEKGVVTYDDAGLKILKNENGVNKEEIGVNAESEAFQDLKSMTDYFGITMDALMEMFDVALNEGSVVLNDGKLESAMPTWAEKLSDACHELGYDVEKIVDSAVKSLKQL